MDQLRGRPEAGAFDQLGCLPWMMGGGKAEIPIFEVLAADKCTHYAGLCTISGLTAGRGLCFLMPLRRHPKGSPFGAAGLPVRAPAGFVCNFTRISTSPSASRRHDEQNREDARPVRRVPVRASAKYQIRMKGLSAKRLKTQPPARWPRPLNRAVNPEG